MTMALLYVFNMVTLDGYFEGPNRDISWHTVDEEFNEFAIQQLDKTGLLMFGRVTYELMAGYWPTSAAVKDDPIVAEKMNSIHKIVFSKTLGSASWNNTSLIKENVQHEIVNLKQQTEKEIGILGSSSLAASLMSTRLIDEYRFMISPVILGKGKTVYSGALESLHMKLLTSRTFRGGNVLLSYQSEKK